MTILARLAGHGVSVLPRVPFTVERHGGRGADAVVVTHRPAGGLPRRLTLVPGRSGLRVELGPGVREAGEVADVAPGLPRPRWVIEAARFSMEWPEGFVFRSSPAPERPPGFDLEGPGGVLLFPQGPHREGSAADGADLVGPSATVTGSGEVGRARWIEVTAMRELVPWRERHYVVPLGAERLVLSLQCPEASADGALYAAADVAAGSVTEVG